MFWNRARVLVEQILAGLLLFGETNKTLKFITLFSQVGGRGKTQLEKRTFLFLCLQRHENKRF